MAKEYENFYLPLSVVSRVAKECIPNNVRLSQEAKTALARSSAIFILYVAAACNEIARDNGRRTIIGEDVFNAMERIEVNIFLEPLKEALKAFEIFRREKKDTAAESKTDKEGATSNGVKRS